ncbi:hypothetical protein AURDEDRAFT_94855 [Auricularia subglabra TFB-10046 SS5]|nr:hypothetical protein AURDEDRAFT_94855 [Auricularia subglabra TFB-10046 SS5]
MYTFCHGRGLTEVWAYMWTSWYRSKMWCLWALSASPRVPRLRTTMVVENFWKQLKHDWLHHLLHPRLDQLVYIICTKVLPVYMHRAQVLEDAYRLGRSRTLRASQQAFKTDWERLQAVPIKGAYSTSVAHWQCNCGAQKYSPFLLCKHLVQAVPDPPAKFFQVVFRRRTTPFYRHPALHHIGEVPEEFNDPDDGAVTDGDDHVWIGNPETLAGADPDALRQLELGLKRKRSATPSSVCSDDVSSYTYDASDLDGADKDALASENHACRLKVQGRIDDLRCVLNALESHMESESADVDLWLRNIAQASELEGISRLAQDLRHKDGNGRARQTTWARGGSKRARRYAQTTMGLQPGLLSQHSS